MTGRSDGVVPGTGSDEERPDQNAHGYWAAVAGTVVVVAGALATLAGAAAGVPGVVVGATLALAAVGLATLCYGVANLTPPGNTRMTTVGFATSVLGVVLAGTGWSPGQIAVAGIPGGVWGFVFGVGICMELVGGVLLPLATFSPEEGDEADDSDEQPATEGSGGATVVIDRENGAWTWRIVTAEGEVLATADGGFEAAGAARDDAKRLVRTFDGGEPRVVRAPSAPSQGVEGRDRREDDAGGGETGSGFDGDAGFGEFVAESGADATFELRETDGGWEWRLRYDGETTLAESSGNFSDLDAAKRSVERVVGQAPEAGALTYDPATFEVYRDGARADEQEWSWRLRHANGEVVAVSEGTFRTRTEAMEAVERVKDGVDADPTVEGERRYGWHLSVAGERVAKAPHGFETPGEARTGFERVRECIPDAGVLEMDPAGFEVSERGGGAWGWRLRHRDGRVLADSPAHASRERAIEGLRTVQRVVPHAEVTVRERETARMIEEALTDAAAARTVAERLSEDERGSEDDRQRAEDAEGQGEREDADADRTGEDNPEEESEEKAKDDSERPEITIEAVDGGEWAWRLRVTDDVVATGDGFADRERAVDNARLVADTLTVATPIRADPGAVEVYREDGWNWRLVDAEGELRTVGVDAFPEADDARDSATNAVQNMDDPEVYRDEGWRWRLRVDDAVVARGARGFDAVEAAREDFRELREWAPEAPLVTGAVLEVHPTEEDWQWRLRDADGQVLAREDPEGSTAEAVQKRLADVRTALDGSEPGVEVVEER